MNHHDDQLRQLLSELADDAPLALGRKEAVMSRVSRRVQRQAAVRGMAALAVAVGLGLGAVGTAQTFQNTSGEGHDGQTSLVTEPTHEPTQEPSHEPTHPPVVTTEPTQGPTAEPTHEPTHETTGSTEDPTHEPTHEATTEPSPENTAASGPLTVTAVMDPGTINAGDTSTAVVTARDGEGRLLAVDIDWGDGTTPFHFSPGDVACPRTTHLDGRFTHKYTTARATPYPVHVTITSGDCAETEKKTVETHVTVKGEPDPTPTPTNGPSLAIAGGSQVNGEAGNVTVHATGSDDDGFVRRIYVDWGDGTGLLVGERGTGDCQTAAGTTHPTPTTWDGTVSHHYADNGEHTVTIQVQSVACDGTHQQNGTKQLAVNQV